MSNFKLANGWMFFRIFIQEGQEEKDRKPLLELYFVILMCIDIKPTDKSQSNTSLSLNGQIHCIKQINHYSYCAEFHHISTKSLMRCGGVGDATAI